MDANIFELLNAYFSPKCPLYFYYLPLLLGTVGGCNNDGKGILTLRGIYISVQSGIVPILLCIRLAIETDRSFASPALVPEKSSSIV